MEAAARSSCEFCAYVLQTLLDRGVLNLHRQVESRLQTLQACGTSSLAISCWFVWGDTRTLMMTLPGLEHLLYDMGNICMDIQACVSAYSSIPPRKAGPFPAVKCRGLKVGK
jgi:hypothetical protein